LLPALLKLELKFELNMIARCEGTMEATTASSLATLEALYVILLKVLFFYLIFLKNEIK
tara:strand:- start:263 stop:439 length:177 start_codon:yes stop_codon:yes gene_type:complete